MQMGASGLSLCLILTLWMTGSRPGTVIAPRSPDSSPGWDRVYQQIYKSALRFRQAGEFHAAELQYQEGYAQASRQGDSLSAVRFLISVTGCEFIEFHYRDALSAFLHARALATQIGDRQDLGAILSNLSSLYLQVWDIPAAMRTAEDGLSEIPRLAATGNKHPYFEAPLLVQWGRLQSLTGDKQARESFIRGIEAARAQENSRSFEPIAWDLLGEQYLGSGNIAEAERAFLQAYRQRILFQPADLGFSEGPLGSLALKQGRLEEAARLTDRALAAARAGKPALPEHMLLHQRGEILLAQGHRTAALTELAAAVEATSRWRREVPASRSALIGADAGLETEIFHSFIGTAAREAVETGDQRWAEQAFEAVETNRAASLRQGQALSAVWHKNLSPEYWEVLAQLNTETAKSLKISGGSEIIERLQSRLAELEAEAGRGLYPKKAENFSSRTSLNHFRSGLRASELFLSFWLGDSESYLWTVDRNRLRVYRAGSRAENRESRADLSRRPSFGRARGHSKWTRVVFAVVRATGPWRDGEDSMASLARRGLVRSTFCRAGCGAGARRHRVFGGATFGANRSERTAARRGWGEFRTNPKQFLFRCRGSGL